MRPAIVIVTSVPAASPSKRTTPTRRPAGVAQDGAGAPVVAGGVVDARHRHGEACREDGRCGEAQAARSAGGDVHGVPPWSWCRLSVRTDGPRPVLGDVVRAACCDLWRVTRGGASFVRWGVAVLHADRRFDRGATACHDRAVATTGSLLADALGGWMATSAGVPSAATVEVPAVDAVGDVDAFVVALFAEHGRSLVRLARLFVDDRNAAEDLVQEAFIRLARNAGRSATVTGAGVPALDRAQPGPRPEPPRARVDAPPLGAGDRPRHVRRGRARAARGPAPGDRRAPRAAGAPAHLPRVALLRRARSGRDRRDARHLAELGQDAPAARAGRARGTARRGERAASDRARGTRLRDALVEGAAEAEPESPDLFARVESSIADDRLLRRQHVAARGRPGVRRRRGRRRAGGSHRSSRRRGAHGLVDPRGADDGAARRHRVLARSAHQAVRAQLRGRRVPGQPAHRQELRDADRRRLLPDLLRLHPVHGDVRAPRLVVGHGRARTSCSSRRPASPGSCSSSGVLHGVNLWRCP